MEAKIGNVTIHELYKKVPKLFSSMFDVLSSKMSLLCTVSFSTGIFTFTDMVVLLKNKNTHPLSLCIYIYINKTGNLSTKSTKHVEANVNT
jgi:hypothetical protein